MNQMMFYVNKCFSQYCDFSGRARRSEYWYFFLFNFIIGLILGILSAIISGGNPDAKKNIFDYLSMLYGLVALLPGVGVSVRRLHDIDKSAWWLLLCFIPFIGSIWFLILMLLPGQFQPNQWGQNPKETNQRFF